MTFPSPLTSYWQELVTWSHLGRELGNVVPTGQLHPSNASTMWKGSMNRWTGGRCCHSWFLLIIAAVSPGMLIQQSDREVVTWPSLPLQFIRKINYQEYFPLEGGLTLMWSPGGDADGCFVSWLLADFAKLPLPKVQSWGRWSTVTRFIQKGIIPLFRRESLRIHI